MSINSLQSEMLSVPPTRPLVARAAGVGAGGGEGEVEVRTDWARPAGVGGRPAVPRRGTFRKKWAKWLACRGPLLWAYQGGSNAPKPTPMWAAGGNEISSRRVERGA
jgi:hypothetical protein